MKEEIKLAYTVLPFLIIVCLILASLQWLKQDYTRWVKKYTIEGYFTCMAFQDDKTYEDGKKHCINYAKSDVYSPYKIGGVYK